jgi:HSP20 family protein
VKEKTAMPEAAVNVPITGETPAEQAASKQTKTEMPLREWWPLETLRREVERAFDEFYRGPWRLPFTRTAFDVGPVWPGEAIWGATPAVDIVEREQDYVISAEMPGVEASDIEVRLSEDRLTIKGEKKAKVEEERKGVFVSERRYGSFQRAFKVPDSVNSDKISATFAHGVLTVTLPKTAEAQKAERKIEVMAA